MTQLALDLGHRAALDADDFLIAPCNRDAVMWVDRWPAWPAPVLIVDGPPACGKTHLAHVWQARSGARTVTADQVSGATPSALLSEGACAVVEDGDHVTDEAALMHLYNVAAEGGGQLLITAATPPARWSLELADLRSRLVAAPAVAIGPPDDGLIAALLIKLFDDRQLRISDGVVEFLLARMERSFEAARLLVTALDDAALASRRNITVPLARQVLNDLEQRYQGELKWISE